MPGDKRAAIEIISSDEDNNTENESTLNSAPKRPAFEVRNPFIVYGGRDRFNFDNSDVEDDGHVVYKISSSGDECNSSSSSNNNEDQEEEYISVGSDQGHETHDSGEDEYYDDEDENEESFLQDNHNDHELNDDERYARMLQLQEIALARSIYQDDNGASHPFMLALISEEEESVDMSYEALLELEESLGEVKRRGLEERTLTSLPRLGYSPTKFKEESRNCVVCMSDFESRQKLIRLPCNHYFHEECAISWLRNRATCPICREKVADIPLTIDLRRL